VEVAEQLTQFIKDGKRVVFSAPTGWGKTHTVLAALSSAKALPAIWMARSLTLGNRVAEDAASWKLHTFIAAGREKTCPLAAEKGEAIHDFCRYFRHKCPYARLPSSLPPATDWQEIAAGGAREKWCAYFAQDLVEADIIVQNYHRRRRPAEAFVIDEAHNLLMPEEKEITLSRLVEAIASARELGASERLLRSLDRMLHYILVKDGNLDVRFFLGEEEAYEIKKLYFLEEGDRRLGVLMNLVKASAVYVEGEKIRVFKPQYALPLRPAVFVSATLPPEAGVFLQTEIEIKVPWTTKPKARVVTDVTTKFEEYTAEMALQYKKLLIEVGKRHKKVLVFAASERVARDLRTWATYEETTPPPDWEGVLLLKARGRFAEGVNLDADAVVMIGAPFLPPEVSDRLARAYKAAGHPDPVRAAIDAPMLIATLQCLGRAWRIPEKTPQVILADWRYEKYVNTLESYLSFQ